MTIVGEIWNLIDVALAGLALVVGLWDSLPGSVLAPEFLGVPILLGGRYPA